jgi:hypothetical protein
MVTTLGQGYAGGSSSRGGVGEPSLLASRLSRFSTLDSPTAAGLTSFPSCAKAKPWGLVLTATPELNEFARSVERVPLSQPRRGMVISRCGRSLGC